MRSLVTTTIVATAVGVFLLSSLPGEAQETRPDPQVPELKPLQRFVGSWEQQVVSKPAEWTPERTTMIITTHDFDRGLAVADRSAVLVGGKIAWESEGRLPNAHEMSDIYKTTVATN